MPETNASPLHEKGRESRLSRFESLAYGLFLHWGLYSLVGRGEWARFHHKMDPGAYTGLMDRFTAEKFDAPALVKRSKSWGFRYICMGSRHHDGFSLYDTRGLNRYDAPHAAAGRDLVAELAEACHDQGMAFFLYHTTLDWWEPRFDTDWSAYLQYLRDSVRILCTQYGKLDGLWFDGNWSRKDRDWEEDALYDMIRQLQPEAMIINNSSVGALGAEGHPALDAVTFEQGLPTGRSSRRVAREMCETLASHWGLALNDFDHKSPAEVIRTLVGCRANGANLLLNAGPEPSGEIPALDSATLDRVGDWIRASGFGKALYEGRPVEVQPSGSDRVLQCANRLYYAADSLPIDQYHSLYRGTADWDRRSLTGDLPKVKSVRWLDNNENLPFTQNVRDGLLSFRSTSNPYGSQYILRIAEIETESDHQRTL